MAQTGEKYTSARRAVLAEASNALEPDPEHVLNPIDRGKYKGRDLSADQPCMFCGMPANSREDIIPTWVSRQNLVPPGTAEPVVYTSHGFPVNEWSSQTLAFLKIKAVCQTCNNGWMSRIEETAKHHLLPMMQGRTVQLSPEAQIQLAVWACLKVMVWESVAEGAVTNLQNRQLMWKHQQPPGYAVVVLARAPSTDWTEFSLQQVFIKAQRKPGAPFDSISATAITLGDLVAWVILNPTSTQGISFRPTPATDDLITIFPPALQSLQWPPTKALTSAELRSVWRRYLVIDDEVKVQHQP
jgi:hypothetical protein